MMNNKPLLSIITPVFNGENYIQDCLKSVSAQDFKNYEHIIIDGLSTDNTVEIIKKFQKDHSKIKYISENDNGIYHAMNKGIEISSGKWVYFLGADDKLNSNSCLKEIEVYLSSSNTNILYGNVWIEKINRNYDGEFNAEKILRRNICHQSIFYPKHIFKKAGMFDQAYKIEADYVFNLKCWLQLNLSFIYINKVIAIYSTDGLSSQGNDIKLKEDYPTLIIKYILYSDRKDSEKTRLLSLAIRKIILRYGLIYLIQLISKQKYKDKYLIRVAIMRMIVSIPRLIFEKKN